MTLMLVLDSVAVIVADAISAHKGRRERRQSFMIDFWLLSSFGPVGSYGIKTELRGQLSTYISNSLLLIYGRQFSRIDSRSLGQRTVALRTRCYLFPNCGNDDG